MNRYKCRGRYCYMGKIARERMIYGAFNLIGFLLSQKHCASILGAIALKQTNALFLLAGRKICYENKAYVSCPQLLRVRHKSFQIVGSIIGCAPPHKAYFKHNQLLELY